MMDGMRIDWDVEIQVSDGNVLRADVFRPAEEGVYPVILTHGPYGKGLPFQVGFPTQWRSLVRDHPEVSEASSCKYQVWETPDPQRWVPDGYVYVRVDSRGAGRSPGVIDIFSPREIQDMHECIEWAGMQSWSNGKVGLIGVSYYAINQWLAASTQPPHLAAICPWEGAADAYRDWHRHGGILSEFTRPWFERQITPVQHGVGVRGPVNPNNGELIAGPETLPEDELARNRVDPAKEGLLRELDEKFYRERSPEWSKVTVPLLSAANWGGLGLHLRGNIEGFVMAASGQKWLEVHGLEHWTHFYTEYGISLQKRFLNHFLKGDDNGWDREPPILLNIRHLGDRFVQRKEQEWPLKRTQWTKYFFDPDDMSLSTLPPQKESRIEYEASGPGLEFRTAPIGKETEVTGPVSAKLFISSSTPDADFFLTIRLFDPNDKEVTFAGASESAAPLAQGWLRVSHRKLDPALTTAYRPYHTHDEKELLVPGECYELDIEIWPTCIVIPPSYYLTLAVQGRDFRRGSAPIGATGIRATYRGSGPFDHDNPWDRRPELYDSQVTIFGGGRRSSYLLLPVVPPAPSVDA